LKRSDIEKLFNSRQYSKVLANLEPNGSSHWHDIIRLRCLRAMGDSKQALANATQLLNDIDANKTPYKLSEAENEAQHRFIALVFAEFGQAKKAIQIMKNLCKNNPNSPALNREYAFALSNNNDFDDAEKHLFKALEVEPSNASSHAQLARIYCRTGRVQKGFNSYSRAATTTQRSNYQLSQLWAKNAFPKNQAGSNTWRTADPDRPLKIAFVSSDFCSHAVSFFITPLLEELSKEKTITVAAYSNTKTPDKITKKVEGLCDVWRDSSNLSDKELAAQISADQIDILIDLNGHTSGNRLAVFSKHIAPIQMSWLGYPSTTGFLML